MSTKHVPSWPADASHTVWRESGYWSSDPGPDPETGRVIFYESLNGAIIEVPFQNVDSAIWKALYAPDIEQMCAILRRSDWYECVPALRRAYENALTRDTWGRQLAVARNGLACLVDDKLDRACPACRRPAYLGWSLDCSEVGCRYCGWRGHPQELVRQTKWLSYKARYC